MHKGRRSCRAVVGIVQSRNRVIASRALLYKLLHPSQPANILLLFLDIDVVGDEQCQGGVDAARVQILLEEALHLLIELLERRAGVDVVGRVAEQIGYRRSWSGLGKVSDAVDGEAAVIGDEVDAQCAFAGALDEDIDVRGVCLLAVIIVVLRFVPISFESSPSKSRLQTYLIDQLFAIRRGNAVLWSNFKVAILRAALVDGSFGVGATALIPNLVLLVHECLVSLFAIHG